ncbi:MAG: anthranilate synthase component I [candidate division Zixibacteria bacterium]|jgi:anthranilate synthase component 1|nr:anthranilate synthase component I [candidate division Zixibacteria bacterium]
MTVNPHPAASALGKRPMSIRSLDMPADLETPVTAFLKLRGHGAKILLESVERGVQLGRYSFIGIAPDTKVTISTAGAAIERPQGVSLIPADVVRQDPLACLKSLLGSYAPRDDQSLPPLLGGLVGYIGYDVVRSIERIPELRPDNLGLPSAMLYLVETLLVFDHVQHRLRLITLSECDESDRAQARLESLAAALRKPLSHSPIRGVAAGVEPQSEFTKPAFCAAVERIKEYISAGEVYQLVLSRRLTGHTDADSFTIYRALRMLNPSPYLFYLDFGDTKLIGSSPEALVTLSGREATVRPIAGTRPRGESAEEDHRMAAELLSDEKERAEHVMLVDLGRNDLGRCCTVGSVRVSEFMEIERFSHVMHMTSTVKGMLRDSLDQFDLFRAAFPAGTVTGAPKIRAMQLIEELEMQQRGPYAGAVGYFSLSGDMDWCIAIRTIVMQGSLYHLQAGAGIVADSVPEREFDETRHKLAALQRAIAAAEEGF